ncbi:MAG: DUF4238 domain-containing protein [Nanoarchaeota archaeon]|nr:DUF4238 domain-containing protein [Nanoarchaeota archaeon]
MTKDHFVPDFIIESFANSEGKIMFYDKENHEVSNPFPYSTQMRKKNFYSRETLNKLKNQFDYILLNPIFLKGQNLNLEDALSLCLETPMGVIASKIISAFGQKKMARLTEEGKRFIKEYIAVQHIRTLSFKRRSIEFNKKFNNFPSEVKDYLIENENSRTIQIRSLIKLKNPNKNTKERFEIEKGWRKKLKKNPYLIQEIREKLFNEKLNKMMKDAEENIKYLLLHPEKHSVDIIDRGFRNSFFKRCDVENLNVSIIVNQTPNHFVLTDTGIVLMSDNPSMNENLEIFLPIHPRILIRLSKSEKEIESVNKPFVDIFNKVSKEDSYKKVYSDSKEILESLV